jgi:hypothetical protein
MKILKIYPEVDTPKRFNYDINFGVWDKIEGDSCGMENFKSDLNEYDVVFLPQIKRWYNHLPLLTKIKNHRIRKVLFDNDSCYRSFRDRLYLGINYIFYRDLDRDERKPSCESSLLRWSVDTGKIQPVYGGSGIAFNCSIGDYAMRKAISTFVKHEKIVGGAYVLNLQKSAAAIHTDSSRVKAVRAKILEFAACGAQIISNRTKNMELYFPDELIIYFDNINQLRDIIKDFKPDIEIQKKLREITVEKHDHAIRAKEVIEILNTKLA